MSYDIKIAPRTVNANKIPLKSNALPSPALGMIGPLELTGLYAVGALAGGYIAYRNTKRQIAGKQLRDMQRFFGEQPLRLRDALKNPLNNTVDLLIQARDNGRILSDRKKNGSTFKSLQAWQKTIQNFEEFDQSKKLFSKIEDFVTDVPSTSTAKQFQKMEAVYFRNLPNIKIGKIAELTPAEIKLQTKIENDFLSVTKNYGDKIRPTIMELLAEIHHQDQPGVSNEEYKKLSDIYSNKIADAKLTGKFKKFTSKENKLLQEIELKHDSFKILTGTDSYQTELAAYQKKVNAAFDEDFLKKTDLAREKEIKQIDKVLNETYVGRLLKSPFRATASSFSKTKSVLNKFGNFFRSGSKVVMPLIAVGAGYAAYQKIQSGLANDNGMIGTNTKRAVIDGVVDVADLASPDITGYTSSAAKEYLNKKIV